MALPDVSFTNNLGTVAFKRCLIGLFDSWEWDGRSVNRTKSISIDGHLRRGDFVHDPEGWEGVLTAGGAAGQTGSLTLPWTVLEEVRIDSISTPVGEWIDYTPFSAQFTDREPSRNRYTLNFFDLELHNPRLSLPLASRRVHDEYGQFPADLSSLLGNDIRPEALRYRSGFRTMRLTLEGSIILNSPALPDGLLEQLAMQTGSSITFQGLPSSDLPVGYPQPFTLQQACPQLGADVDFGGLILESTTVDWAVEQDVARLSFAMHAQPQRYVGV